MARVPSFKLFPHQREVLKYIERWTGAVPPAGAVVEMPPPRFNTPRLATKLAHALHGKTT